MLLFRNDYEMLLALDTDIDRNRGATIEKINLLPLTTLQVCASTLKCLWNCLTQSAKTVWQTELRWTCCWSEVILHVNCFFPFRVRHDIFSNWSLHCAIDSPPMYVRTRAQYVSRCKFLEKLYVVFLAYMYSTRRWFRRYTIVFYLFVCISFTILYYFPGWNFHLVLIIKMATSFTKWGTL